MVVTAQFTQLWLRKQHAMLINHAEDLLYVQIFERLCQLLDFLLDLLVLELVWRSMEVEHVFLSDFLHVW